MNLFYNILLYTVWFVSAYYVILLLLLLISGRDSLYDSKRRKILSSTFVSVVVPAYNEAGKIGRTIASLKKIRYDCIEFIVVNDGSTDSTAREARQAFGRDARFSFIDRRLNLGKAASLNEGIAAAKGEFITTIDADSIIEPDLFSKVLPYFDDSKVAAVTVAVRVKNPRTLLHKIFELEYIIGLSLLLKIFSFFNAIFVTPGPCSIYRKSVLKEIGGFNVNNITEDMEIAYRIQKGHYRIENCMDAKVYTLIPPTFKKLLAQRKRWYTGALCTLSQHRDVVLNKKYGYFGLFVFLNFAIILSGLALFNLTVYLGLSNLVESLLYYQYTSFNYFEQLKSFNLDLLMISRSSMLGLLSLFFTFATLFAGLYFTKTRWSKKLAGAAAYPLLFFLYQLFWIVSITAFVTGRKVKWR
jgi:peptidoglycan-N-acetylglucosamine deacetylase